ncbi:MAG: hypothetical protein DWI29_03750 [Planctomycetota bacterium]|nr:MAG: hypothetical protein DWI29_03750 [Planctomycetota bacterium]
MAPFDRGSRQFTVTLRPGKNQKSGTAEIAQPSQSDLCHRKTSDIVGPPLYVKADRSEDEPVVTVNAG